MQGGTIRGSLNLPAQSLFASLPTLYALLANTSVKQVVWYCGKYFGMKIPFCQVALSDHPCFDAGSSGGRGPRAASWFADYLAKKKNTVLESLVLEGGIKGWVAAGADYTEWMEGYDAKVWASK